MGTRLVFATASAAAAAAVYFTGRLYAHMTTTMFALDAHLAPCGDNPAWAWSFDSDCFRAGFLWPALLSTVLIISTTALALSFVLQSSHASDFANDGSAPLARMSVGSKKAPVRRPPGPVIMVDNRLRVGSLVVLLLAIQTALQSFWWQSTASVDTSNDIPYSRALAETTAAIWLCSVVCLAALWRSDRMLYAGLFPWILPALVAIQFGSSLVEVYASFFADKNLSVPIVGPHASLRSNILVSTTALGLVLLVSFSCVQQRPIFFLPFDNSESASSDPPCTPRNSVSSNPDNKDDDDESTPLTNPTELSPSRLVDTPEFSSSWFDRIFFSWQNDLLRKGFRRQLQYSDLYRLHQVDTPLHNWKRYMRHRKPGRSLLATMALAFAPELAIQAILSISMCCLRFAGPFFLQRILRTIELLNDKSPSSTANLRKAYLHAFGLLVSTLLVSVLYNQTMLIGRRVGACVKGLLVAELASNMLSQRGKGHQESDKDAQPENGKSGTSDVGPDPAAVDGQIMNILTADSGRVSEVSVYLDQLYYLPLSLGIGIWYMYHLLGTSALVGLSFVVIYVPLTKSMFVWLTDIEKKAKAISDKRISIVSEIVQGIKAVKLFGWESRFLASAEKQRENQLVYFWKALVWRIYIGAVAALGPMLILVIIFTTYVAVLGKSLTAETAFTSISVFQLVRYVFEHFPSHLSWCISGYVSLGRIDAFLGRPQAQDLEDRIAQEHCDSLGLNSAYLEWESPKDQDNASTDSRHAYIRKPPSEGTSLLTESSSHTQGSLPRREMATASFALNDIDIRFPDCGLSLVAGPTGSGKSSLLSALIGDMTLTRGHIVMPTIRSRDVAARNNKYKDVIELSGDGLVIRDIAYVSQEAWLRNATIRENILFGEAYNRERYEEVLRVCALKPDLRILVAGDMTEIGERGVTLSGGQKQRVALARAVYSSRRILLIDDCLSAVDAHTAKHILIECLSSKSALMQGRMRVLVTHHVAMCLPYAQYMVMMREGRIVLKGAPADLQNQDSLAKALAALDSRDSESPAKRSTKHEKAPALVISTANVAKGIAILVDGMKPEDEYNAERLRIIAEHQVQNPGGTFSALQGTLVDEEEREMGRIRSRVWKVYLSACGTRSFWVWSLFLMCSWQGVVILQDYWIRIWVSSSDESSATSSNVTVLDNTAAQITKHHSVVYWLGVYVLIGLSSVVWRILYLLIIYRGSIKASRRIHSQLLHAIVHATPRFFDSTPIGRIISRFSRDMDVIDDSVMDILTALSSDILAVLAIYLVILTVAPMFVLVAMFVSLLYAYMGSFYINTSRELRRLEANSMSPLLSLFSEMIQGLSTVRAFGAKHYYTREAMNRMCAHMRPFGIGWLVHRWIAVRIDVAGSLISFSCAVFILTNLGRIDAGLAGFVLAYALTFSDRMFWVIRNYSDNQLNMNSVERVVQYLRVDQEAALESDPENKPPAVWPQRGDVHIENLDVEYTPGVPVLHDISLSVKHGEKIGIVGRTGAGKSSMSLALLRYLEASKGRIVLDGVDISTIGLEDLRRNVTIIPQDPVLFNGSIRFNLDPFDEHPDELLWDALRRTHLVRERESQTNSSTASVAEGAKDETPMLERMVGIFTSLDAEIKENGQNLSQGQRQLVSLARALVRRSKLIIMDEATASVDFDTDERIQRTIRGPEFANSTLFCIAHRLRTIIDYDKVLVLDNGKVAEFDTPHNLLQIENGIFRGMCEKADRA